jgi:hypothetical protein
MVFIGYCFIFFYTKYNAFLFLCSLQVGKPCSGKGTQCSKIVKNFRFVYLSVK